MDSTDTFLAALRDAGKVVKQTGEGRYIAQCPSHPDKRPSLSIGRGRGQVILYCFANCTPEDIVDSLSLQMSDLFDDSKGNVYETWNKSKLVRRAYRSPTKAFHQDVYETGPGTIYVTPGIDLEAAIQAGSTVLVVEGEKDCDTVSTLGGAIAVTNSGGAGSWGSFDWSPLKDAINIVVVADHDKPGYDRVQNLGNHLRKITKATVTGGAPKAGKDVTDHILAGFGVQDLGPIEIVAVPEKEDPIETAIEHEKVVIQIREEARKRARQEASSKLATPLSIKTLREILDLEFDDDWVIPGLLEKADRLILTGIEGGGKSYFLRQMAIMAASGLNPFTQEPINPVNVLVIDAENSERQWARTTRYLAGMAERAGARSPKDHVTVSAGFRIDLGVQSDVDQIHRLIDEHEPSILLIGPLYKLVSGEITTDDDAAPLIKTLDAFRERGIALLMEAHSGHAGKMSKDLRPRGSSALLGWPEFGFGLLPDTDNDEFVDLVRWRGDREQRDWPRGFRKGAPGELPWMPQREF